MVANSAYSYGTNLYATGVIPNARRVIPNAVRNLIPFDEKKT